MIRRRQIDPGREAPRMRSIAAGLTARLRAVVWALQERVVWSTADLLRGFFDVIRWPFERVAWVVERAVIWPLRERSTPVRAVALGSAALLATGALAFGAIRVTQEGEDPPAVAIAPVSSPAKTTPPPEPIPEPADPVLQGAVPDFTTKADGSAAKVADADAVSGGDAGAVGSSATSSSSTASTAAADAATEDPGPAAIDVARRFSGAFVLYETGDTGTKVRTALAATATPELARALLRRPPRLPANVEVPKAKVLNVVPGPRNGDTFTLSASLLRVGITSELRIDVQREKSGEWQVTDVLG